MGASVAGEDDSGCGGVPPTGDLPSPNLLVRIAQPDEVPEVPALRPGIEKPFIDLGRHPDVVVDPAAVELDLQNLVFRVVADRFDVGGLDGLALHGGGVEG